MEALAQLMAGMMGFDPGLATEAIQNCGINLDRFGQQRTKHQILQEHEEGRKGTYPISQIASRDMQTITYSNDGDVKPLSDFPTPPNISQCTPIQVADLQQGTTHRGRLLRGKLIVDANYICSVHSVLEDAAGDCVKVFIYNHPGVEAGTSYYDKLAAAQTAFVRGTTLAIVEPYFKLMSDGSYGVRVDNPAEVVFLNNLCPSDVAGWQQEGKICFQAKQYKHAAAAYGKALQLMQDPVPSLESSSEAASATLADGALLLQLLLNTSAAHYNLQQPLPALAYASAAVAFSNHTSSKAFYRLALAVDALVIPETPPEASGSAVTASSPLASTASMLMSKSLELMSGVSPTYKQQVMAQMTSWKPHHNSGTSTGTGTSSRKKKGDPTSKDPGGSDGQISAAWGAICGVMLDSLNQTLTRRHGRSNPLCDSAAGRAAADDMAGFSSCGRPAATTSTGGSEGSSSSSRESSAVGIKSHSAAELKEMGNKSFRSGDFATALEQYEAALHHAKLQHTLSQGAVLLSNRSACWLQLGGQQLWQQAAVDASAALVLDQNQVKPFYRAASAMLQLGLTPAATEMCQWGLQVHPGNTFLMQLQTRLTTSTISTNASKSSSMLSSSTATCQQASACKSSSSGGGGSGKFVSEREYAQLHADQRCSVEQVSLMNQMASIAAQSGRPAPGQQRLQMVDDRIPSFHEEFAKAGRWPPQVDISTAQRMLWEGYETARSLPMHMTALTSSESIEPEKMAHRMGAMPAADEATARTKWLLEAPAGDVRFHPRAPYGGAFIFQSFNNVAAHSELLTPGTTHVAVGFVDLGSLAASCKALKLQQPATSVSNKQHVLKPLRWVGFDMSAYAVAKTHVLLEMIKLDSAVDSILQAWFSSAWSDATLSAFRSALSSILQQQQQQRLEASQRLLPAAVSDLLHHWQAKDVTLSAAMSAWLADRNHTCTYIANFQRKRDRLALAKYQVTGQLLDSDVGSVMMFAVPDSYGKRALDENFLQALPFSDLTARLRKGGARGADIIEVGTEMLMERIRDLKGMITSAAVTAEVRLATVAPSAASTLAAIRALNPYTISWSNVPDYYEPAAFQRMARAVSSEEDTVHFMHSMNWARDVKGAFHLDKMLMIPDKHLPKVMRELLSGSCQGINALYTAKRLDKLLLSPPADNPRNIIDYSLFYVHHKKWVSAFFDSKVSGIKRFEQQVQVVQPPEYSVLNRANSTMHISFTYDEDIKFNVISRPAG